MENEMRIVIPIALLAAVNVVYGEDPKNSTDC